MVSAGVRSLIWFSKALASSIDASLVSPSRLIANQFQATNPTTTQPAFQHNLHDVTGSNVLHRLTLARSHPSCVSVGENTNHNKEYKIGASGNAGGYLDHRPGA